MKTASNLYLPFILISHTRLGQAFFTSAPCIYPSFSYHIQDRIINDNIPSLVSTLHSHITYKDKGTMMKWINLYLPFIFISHTRYKRYVIVTQSKRIGCTYFKEFLISFEKILTNDFYMISFCFLSIHLYFSNDTICQLALMLVYNTIISLF